jgi:dienelactone hydrolase
VLVHGGGNGTAFSHWVNLWVQRGYAAIAMDLKGRIPGEKDQDNRWPKHDFGGPDKLGHFLDYQKNVEDQWTYHAVADVILANSLLASFPEVDQERIGLTGISWGAVVGSLVAGVDSRFKFCIPVYGCGYLYEMDNIIGDAFKVLGSEADRIIQLWDPSSYFHNIRMPMLWITGSNDQGCSVYHFSKSHTAIKSDSRLSIQYGLNHSHAHGWSPEEIYAFADSIVKDGLELPRISRYEVSGDYMRVEYSSETDVTGANLYYASDASDWFKIDWSVENLKLDKDHKTISAILPKTSKAYFINIMDERGLMMSTPILINL